MKFLIQMLFFFNKFQLTFECGVGIAVLVRCFVEKRATEDQISSRLGDGFSRAPFATVVVCFRYILNVCDLFAYYIKGKNASKYNKVCY